MDDIKINGKAIYTTKGAAREYGRVDGSKLTF